MNPKFEGWVRVLLQKHENPHFVTMTANALAQKRRLPPVHPGPPPAVEATRRGVTPSNAVMMHPDVYTLWANQQPGKKKIRRATRQIKVAGTGNVRQQEVKLCHR